MITERAEQKREVYANIVKRVRRTHDDVLAGQDYKDAEIDNA